MTLRHALVFLALATGCKQAPAGPPLGDGTPDDQACAARDNNSESRLVECIRQAPLWNHMIAFQQIADANPGPDGHASRNAGEPGYLASVNYVAALLRTAGYLVTIQPYTLVYSVFASSPSFSVVSPTPATFALNQDFRASSRSGSGDITAVVQRVGGIIVPATPTPTSASGCNAADYSTFVAGRIALVQRGTCTYPIKIQLAQDAGAAAVIVFNEGNPGRTAADATCSPPAGTTIPVVCLASYAVGVNLYNQSLGGSATVHLKFATINDPARLDYNLIADAPNGDPNHVVVVDAHLDAIFGAGMLDNASGSATILEIALKLARTPTRSQLRYIWFGGEELGLLGSFHYMQSLSPTELSKIVFDVDADVTATPNYVIAIADPANSGNASTFPPSVLTASQLGNNYFVSYFQSAALPYQRRSNDGTDSYAFATYGVPNTGILTGQDCCKSAQDVALFGGTVGNYEGNLGTSDGGFVDRPFLWGDNLGNNDPQVLTKVSKAVASVVFKLANDASINSSSGAGTVARPALVAGDRAIRYDACRPVWDGHSHQLSGRTSCQ